MTSILAIRKHGLGKVEVIVRGRRFEVRGAFDEHRGGLLHIVGSRGQQARQGDSRGNSRIVGPAESVDERLTSALVFVLTTQKQAQFGVAVPGLEVRRVGVESSLPNSANLVRAPVLNQDLSEMVDIRLAVRIQQQSLLKLLERLIQLTLVNKGGADIAMIWHGIGPETQRFPQLPQSFIIVASRHERETKSLVRFGNTGTNGNRAAQLCKCFIGATALEQSASQIAQGDDVFGVEPNGRFVFSNCFGDPFPYPQAMCRDSSGRRSPPDQCAAASRYSATACSYFPIRL